MDQPQIPGKGESRWRSTPIHCRSFHGTRTGCLHPRNPSPRRTHPAAHTANQATLRPTDISPFPCRMPPAPIRLRWEAAARPSGTRLRLRTSSRESPAGAVRAIPSDRKVSSASALKIRTNRPPGISPRPWLKSMRTSGAQQARLERWLVAMSDLYCLLPRSAVAGSYRRN